MQERRKHKRLPVIRDLAEPIEISFVQPHSKQVVKLPGILTNLSAGGMDLVLMGLIDGKLNIKMNMHLPGFDHFEIEGRIAWTHPKGSTTQLGIAFTKIDPDHAKQLNHMAEAYWECEDRINTKAPIICFHGCTYWDLCEKPAKLKTAFKPSFA